MHVYNSDMHGYSRICTVVLGWMYGALTDDGVPRHGLANHCSIAAQKNGNRGTVRPAVQLRGLVHAASVEGAIHTVPRSIHHHFRLGVLTTVEARVAEQLLDGVVQAR